MIILDGKTFAKEIKENVKSKVEKLEKKPALSCIIVEGDSASEIYVANKQKACAECGLISKMIRLPHNVGQAELEQNIEDLNANEDVSAILLQLPIPKNLDTDRAINKILPEKDVDCLTFSNAGRLFAGKNKIAPCTPTGIIKLLEKYNVQIAGKLAVVVGRSELVGKPVAMLLEQKNATVILCHSKTGDERLKELTRMADILIVAVGKPKFITAEHVKPGAVVVDVGINRVDGKIYGDVDFESVKNICSMITPVPGGVGPLTVACLMENTYLLATNEKEV